MLQGYPHCLLKLKSLDLTLKTRLRHNATPDKIGVHL